MDLIPVPNDEDHIRVVLPRVPEVEPDSVPCPIALVPRVVTPHYQATLDGAPESVTDTLCKDKKTSDINT